ncbi:uncharacterized protein LOC141907726 [Tubulanus polymorphus]|uniref:uncharacterized protein LOC141907726 n=1 Tax=Tubulanus polymorphus TaxID=672921 RepID=UPI003DA6B251
MLPAPNILVVNLVIYFSAFNVRALISNFSTPNGARIFVDIENELILAAREMLDNADLDAMTSPTLRDFNRFHESIETSRIATGDHLTDNPIQLYHSAVRLGKYWPHYVESLTRYPRIDSSQAMLDFTELARDRLSVANVTDGDISFTIATLIRLRRAYDIPIKQLIAGHLVTDSLTPAEADPLDADDVFAIGTKAIDLQMYSVGLTWYGELLEMLENGEESSIGNTRIFAAVADAYDQVLKY